MEFSSEYINYTIAIIGLLSAISGFLFYLWRRIKHVYHICDDINKLCDKFGNPPFRAIGQIVASNQAEIAETSIRQRIIENQIGVGIYCCATDGRCTWGNDVLCEGFKLDSQEMLGWGWTAAISEKDRDRVVAKWSKCVKELLPYEETYTVIPADKKSPHWVAYTEAWPVIVENRLVCMIGYIKKLPDAPPQ